MYKGTYSKLNEYLGNYKVKLNYKEIEDILGRKLPASAYKHREWWANGGHEHAKAWLEAGWKVEGVDLGNSVTFTSLRNG